MRSLPTCTFLNNIGENPQSIDSPLQMRLIKFLGLKNYMMDNFIFRRKPTKYFIRQKNNKNQLFMESSSAYEPPSGYAMQVKIIETSSHSVPICRLSPIHRTNRNVIIYAHGNASDMSDSLRFVQRLCQLVQAEFIIFDYSGYGESRVSDVGEEIICQDLEIVLAWAQKFSSLDDIILWGFSLGTFPVVFNAVKYKVNSVILQCPIASVNCIFYQQLHPDLKFTEDHFANINFIGEVQSRMLIMHSSADEIIPFAHGKTLYEKFIARNGDQNIQFIEVGQIKHNSLHKFIVSAVENDLQREVLAFIAKGVQASTQRRKLLQQNGQHSLMLAKSNIDLRSVNAPVDLKSRTSRLHEKSNGSFHQLKRLQMMIVEADTEKISEDMHELVIEEDRKTIKQTIIEDRLLKNCFCFPKNS